ncbi:MAG TPA: hypothetical protein DCK98_01265, partial [Chloroflexi bacterium]|nr:hypothetical protein [Chloroflexota bacterium]
MDRAGQRRDHGNVPARRAAAEPPRRSRARGDADGRAAAAVKVRVEHITRFEYDTDVVESVIDVRLGPRSDAHQRWGRFNIVIDPAGAIRRYGDGFGNTGFLVTLARPHRHLELRTTGEIETLLA